MTQAHRLIKAIRKSGKRGMTYLELNFLGISTCPHKRLSAREDPTRWLQPWEELKRKRGSDGLVRFFVVGKR